MPLEVLVSTMHRKDLSLMEAMNIRTNAVIINQTNADSYEETGRAGCKIKVFSTTERGLSRSRNMAIEKAGGDICLIADDDVRYNDNYEQAVRKAYVDYPAADMIAFIVNSTNPQRSKQYKNKEGRLGFIGLLRIASFEISFNRQRLLAAGVRFNPRVGAGSEFAGVGEESLFLQDCRKAGLTVYFVPVEIGTVSHQESTWFSGYTEKYFFSKGMSGRLLMGRWGGVLFSLYFALFKYGIYRKDISMIKALRHMLRGTSARQPPVL